MSDQETMNPEQAADFAALQAMSDQGGLPGQPGQEPAAPERDLSAEIAALMTIAVTTLGPALPSLKEIYTEPAIQTAAGVTAALCDKHGWMQGGVMGKYGEEIAALAVLGPLAYATYNGVAGDLAKMKKPGPEAGPGAAQLSAPIPDPAHGLKTVQIGNPVPSEA
jgi:hypothetical protein